MSQQNNSLLDNIPDQELIHKLQLATHNLLWMSEAEYPWQIFYWRHADTFRQDVLLDSLPANTNIVIQKLPSFFDSATKVQSWHNDAEKDIAQRYQLLLELITANLAEIKVYLLGEVEIKAYILGTTKHNAIAGIVTTVIST